MPDQTAANRFGRIHGLYNTADASTAGTVTWYELGTNTAIVPAADQRIALISAIVSVDAQAHVQIFADANDNDSPDAGESVIDYWANSLCPLMLAWNVANMPEGLTGGNLKILASSAVELAATFEAILREPITKSGPVGNPPHDSNVGAR